MLSILHTAQNQWLQQNVLDAHGNLLFCRDCFITTLDTHSKRLHKQCLIKQQLNRTPVVHMTKKLVTDERLHNYVLRSVRPRPLRNLWEMKWFIRWIACSTMLLVMANGQLLVCVLAWSTMAAACTVSSGIRWSVIHKMTWWKVHITTYKIVHCYQFQILTANCQRGEAKQTAYCDSLNSITWDTLKHEQLGQFGLIVPSLCSEFLVVLIKRHCSFPGNNIMEVSKCFHSTRSEGV